MKKVLYIQPIHPSGMNRLREKYNVVVAQSTDHETLMREIVDASAIVSRLTPIDAELMAAGRCLQAIAKHGVGLDNFDVEYARAHGIAVLTTGDANSSTVAEHAMFALGALLKRIPMLDREMHAGNWASRDLPGACDAAGRTLAVLGFGRIGQCMARMAKHGFSMNVRVFDPYASRDQVEAAGHVFCESAAEAMTGADAVSPHVPLTAATRGLVNRENLALMHHGCYVLNFSRGGIVDCDALEEAALSGHVAGAALDTFDIEPPKIDRPLFRHENVILSPHCGTFTEDSRRRMSMRLAEEIDRVLSQDT